MAGLSDDTIVTAIKTLIEADATLYHASTKTLINKVFTEQSVSGKKPQKNYAVIMATTASLDEDDGQLGDGEALTRTFNIIFVFRQTRKENNARLYNAVLNFREAVGADRELSTGGILKAMVTGYDYGINSDGQSTLDTADITLDVITTEVL